MNEAPHIVFCHCAYAQVVPKDVKEAVLHRLRGSGVAFESAADLCELAARGDPVLRRLTASGPLKIAACFPRAVRWLFAAGGAPLPPGGAQILNMRVLPAAEVSGALLSPEFTPNLPAGTTEVASGRLNDTRDEVPGRLVQQAGAIRDAMHAAKPAPWKPWFPVIDYDRCTNCMQCLSFCLFGVFGVDAHRRIAALNPAACKTHCPACSRVCPEAAIMFPQYASSPINGDEVSAADLRREKLKIDVSALLGGDVYSLLRDRSERAKSRFSKERDAEKALRERQKCLAVLAQLGDIPPEVLMSLPSPEEIQRRAAEAMAKARAAQPS